MLEQKVQLLFAELRKPKVSRSEIQFLALFTEVIALVDVAEDIDFSMFASLSPEERKATMQLFLAGLATVIQ